MIERLLDGERQLGGEAYHNAMAQILEVGDALTNLLDDTGRQWLEKLGDAYGQRERAVMEAAFRRGSARRPCWRWMCLFIRPGCRRIKT